jgi:phospholipase/carboxylesterase
MNYIKNLPKRKGPKPQTGPAIPHQQLSQIAPITLQQQLWDRMQHLAHIIQGRSYVSMPDTRALHMEPDHAKGPRTAFMMGTEFCHLHGPSDGSLHMALPPKVVAEVIATGWGEVHPIVRDSHNPTLVMVYGPRDDDELEIAWELVQRSYNYASTAPQ